MYFSKRLLSFIFLWKDGGRLLFSFLDYSNLSFNGDIKCCNSVILGGKYPNQKQYITALFSFFLLFYLWKNQKLIADHVARFTWLPALSALFSCSCQCVSLMRALWGYQLISGKEEAGDTAGFG